MTDSAGSPPDAPDPDGGVPEVPALVAFTSLSAAVEHALESTPHLPRDRAAVETLRTYARMIDDALDRVGEAEEEDAARDFGRMVMAVAKIGPRLEAMIEKLGMSPGARRSDGSPHADDPAAAALERLRRDAAAARIGGTPAVDPAVEAALSGDVVRVPGDLVREGGTGRTA